MHIIIALEGPEARPAAAGNNAEAGLFVLVPLLFPGGLIGIPQTLRRSGRSPRRGFEVIPPARIAEGSAP